MFTSSLFLVSLFVLHTFSTGLKKPWLDDIDGPKFLREAKQSKRAEEKDLDPINNAWLDDIDGPKFLRGAKQRTYEEHELDSINDFPREWRGVVRDNNVIYAPSNGESMICEVAAAPEGINTTTWDANSTAISPSGAPEQCGLFPTMVELSRAPGENLYPASHVILHRCVGSCNQQDAHNCTVTNQEEIEYSVTELVTMTQKAFKVYNHTGCACNCKKRESDCDLTIENYVVGSCSCECKLNGSHCSVNHAWSSGSCQCQCINQPLCDANDKQFLNETTCECDCPQNVKNRCKRKGKVLNIQECGCECPTPLPTCGSGTSFLKHNCTCV